MNDPIISNDLFSIDVASEVRKLCGEQFASDADRLAQIVRVLITHGATSIRVDSRRARTTIFAEGAVLPLAVLDPLRVLRDPDVPATARHKALAQYEQRGGSVHLVFAGETTLLLESAGQRLSLSPGSAQLSACSERNGTFVQLDRRIAEYDYKSFAKLCRFAVLPIEVQKKRVSFGRRLPDALCWDAFEGDDYDGVVGLPVKEEICRTVFLCCEIVCRETYGVSPNGFAHTAVVHDRQARLPNQVRREVLSKKLRQHRISLYQELARKLPKLSPRARRKATELLVMRAERSGDLSVLAQVPVFECLGGAVVAPEELQKHTVDGVLWAIESGRSQTWRHSAVKGRVFVLTKRERSLIEKHMGFSCSEPPLQAQEALWVHKLRTHFRPAFVELWALVMGRVFCSLPVDRQQLSADEQQLLSAMRKELKSGRYVLKGVAPGVSKETRVALAKRAMLPARCYRIDRKKTLLLPRDHALVRRAVMAIKRDARAVYPVMVALLAGHDGYGVHKNRVQEAWLTS